MAKQQLIHEMMSGYCGTPQRWFEFVSLWDRKRVELNLEDCDKSFSTVALSPDLIAEREARLRGAEERLKLILPKSYRDFVIATGGEVPKWFAQDYWATGMFVPEAIGWLGDVDPRLVGWYPQTSDTPLLPGEEWDWYSSEQDFLSFYSKGRNYFAGLLAISPTDDDLRVLLLNPLERTKDGEWGAFDYEAKTGALRLPSFAWMIYYFYLCDFMEEDEAWELCWNPPEVDPHGIARLLFSE